MSAPFKEVKRNIFPTAKGLGLLKDYLCELEGIFSIDKVSKSNINEKNVHEMFAEFIKLTF